MEKVIVMLSKLCDFFGPNTSVFLPDSVNSTSGFLVICLMTISRLLAKVCSHTDSQTLPPEPSVSGHFGLETSTEKEPDVAGIFNDDKWQWIFETIFSTTCAWLWQIQFSTPCLDTVEPDSFWCRYSRSISRGPCISELWLIQAVQLRLAFHEARSEADKIIGSNLGIKEQEVVIEKLTEQVNAKRWLSNSHSLMSRNFIEHLRKEYTTNNQNGDVEEDAMDVVNKSDDHWDVRNGKWGDIR